MTQRFETQIQFTCPDCHALAVTSAEVPEPDWSAAESMSDLNSEGATEVECPHCETVFEAYVVNSAGSCEVRLNAHPETAVSADVAFYSPEEDWSDYALPENPLSIWAESFEQAQAYLDAHGSDDGGALINRMVFSQHVAALEAFLGDTLLKEVLGDEKRLGRLLAGDKELAKERFTLAEIQENPGLIRDRVGAYLADIRYHNLAKVDTLYRIALEVELLKEQTQREKLFVAIQHRHDCVHRNGRDKNNEKLTVFTKAYVTETAELFRALIERVDLALSPF
jgi:hypothetical protein